MKIEFNKSLEPDRSERNPNRAEQEETSCEPRTRRFVRMRRRTQYARRRAAPTPEGVNRKKSSRFGSTFSREEGARHPHKQTRARFRRAGSFRTVRRARAC